MPPAIQEPGDEGEAARFEESEGDNRDGNGDGGEAELAVIEGLHFRNDMAGDHHVRELIIPCGANDTEQHRRHQAGGDGARRTAWRGGGVRAAGSLRSAATARERKSSRDEYSPAGR